MPQVIDLGRSRQEAFVLAEQLHHALAYYGCCDAVTDQAKSARDGVFLFHLYAGETPNISCIMYVLHDGLGGVVSVAASRCLLLNPAVLHLTCSKLTGLIQVICMLLLVNFALSVMLQW